MGKMNEGVAAEAPRITYRLLRDLKLYERNARTHPPEQLEELMRGFEEFGYTNPVLVDEEGVVAGHGRIAAAGNYFALGKKLYWPDGTRIPDFHLPTLDCTGWSEEKRRAYILWDNKSALNSGWNDELLRSELEWLQEHGVDLSLTGFRNDELDAIFEPIVNENTRDPDAAPPPPEVPHTQPGDVWILGAHRVRCGDSTDVASWRALLQGTEHLDAIWTDPPYNVAYESKLAGKIKNDDMAAEDFGGLLRGIFTSLFAVTKPGGAIYVAHADTEGQAFRKAFADAGFKLSGCLIWRKQSLVLGRSDYQWMHEPILYGWKPGSKHRWFGGRKQTTVQDLGDGSPFERQADGRWAIRMGDTVLVVDGEAQVTEHPSTIVNHEKPKRSAHHPTMKPVGLIEKQLRHSARIGDLIGDACGGSGSTLMAADRLGMVARIMELDPKFVDVIVRRWQNYTGRAATLEATGQPFPIAPNPEEAF